MFTSLSDFYNAAGVCIDRFNQFAQKHVLAGKVKADHICFKCASVDSFESIRSLFENESVYIYQSIISGRRIAYIRFKTPLNTELGPIWFLELSDQKSDLSQKEGFDHIEAYPIAGTYEAMVEGLRKTETVIHVERPHHTTDDVEMGDGFLFRATVGPLIEKIKRDEMN